jgi:virulence factor Mce-like protein
MPPQRRHGIRRAMAWPLDHPWLLVVTVGAVLFVYWAVGTRSQPHHVRAEFTSAFNLFSGESVDVNGLAVGKISGVSYQPSLGGAQAIVDIGISDAQVWPLHAGTTVEIRWGSTIGNGTRRLDLVPGPASAPVIRDGGIINTQDTLPAVNLDQVFNVFTRATRPHLTRLVGNLSSGVSGNETALHNGVNTAPPAVLAANGVLADLASNTYALQGLVYNGDRLTSVLASRAPAISDLVTVAGQTFSALSAHAGGVEQSIADLPGALSEARGTLARLDSSVGILNGLITDIRPGAAKLSPLAIAMRPTLAALRRIVPTGVATLSQATAAAPSITRLLDAGIPFMPKLQTVTAQLAPMVACMRPYSPELAGAITNANSWIQTYALERPNATPGVTFTGAQQGQFVRQHGIRAMPQVSATTLHAVPPGITTQAFVAATGKGYAEPRPPGLSVGQPVFLPQCGVGPNSLNPAADPEQHP